VFAVEVQIIDYLGINKFVPHASCWASPGFSLNGLPDNAGTLAFEVKLAPQNQQSDSPAPLLW
jgi:hypothetical protein